MALLAILKLTKASSVRHIHFMISRRTETSDKENLNGWVLLARSDHKTQCTSEKNVDLNSFLNSLAEESRFFTNKNYLL